MRADDWPIDEYEAVARLVRPHPDPGILLWNLRCIVVELCAAVRALDAEIDMIERARDREFQ